MWVLSPGLGCYLAFYSYPRMGVTGLWVGLVTGMSLLAFSLLVQVALLDWEAVARRVVYLASKGGEGTGGSGGAYSRGIVLQDISVPAIGSRSTGGFSLAQWSVTLEEELDELEHTERPLIADDQKLRHPTKSWLEKVPVSSSGDGGGGAGGMQFSEMASLLSGADSKDHDSDGDEGEDRM